MLAHLPIVILTALHPVPVADAVPKLDIARECQFEGGAKPVQERCAADETQARNQLQNEWKQFAPDRKSSAARKAPRTTSPVTSNCRHASKWSGM